MNFMSLTHELKTSQDKGLSVATLALCVMERSVALRATEFMWVQVRLLAVAGVLLHKNL